MRAWGQSEYEGRSVTTVIQIFNYIGKKSPLFYEIREIRLLLSIYLLYDAPIVLAGDRTPLNTS